MTNLRFPRQVTLAVLLAGLVLFGSLTPAQAGCGCENLPPPPATGATVGATHHMSKACLQILSEIQIVAVRIFEPH